MFSEIKYPELKNIKITDDMWMHYINMVSEVMIPYQWEILNDRVEDAAASHCLDNFRIAAGLCQGEFYGMVFQDSDVYKWLEAVAFAIENGTGKKFEKIADEVIDLIGKAQQKDGYLNTYYTIKAPTDRFTNLREGHELYCSGHMMEAACAYYHATGKTKFLEIAKRNANLLCCIFGPEEGQIHGYPGHQEIENGLIKLYKITKEDKYLELAKYFIETRGTEPNYFVEEMKTKKGAGIFPEMENYDLKYAQCDCSPLHQKDANGHAVRAMYMYSAMTDIASICESKEWMNACDALWDSTINRRMYLTGGIGSSGYLERFTTDYDLPNDRAYCESCASIGLMMFGRRMAGAKKDASYMDIVEKALYNTVLAGINREGNRYFYVNVLEVWPDNCLPNTSMAHVKPVRQKWFDVACCPTNIARTLASIGQYIYAYDNNSVYIDLFISSKVEIIQQNESIEIDMQSDMVKTGKVIIIVNNKKKTELCIRIPDYGKEFSALLNYESVNKKNRNQEIKNGYLKLLLEEGRNQIDLQFNIQSEWIMANPLVRADSGKTALARGPFIYCLEEIDNGKNIAATFVKPGEQVTEESREEVSEYVPCLSYRGKKLRNWNVNALYQNLKYELEDQEFHAVPYFIWGNRTPGEMAVWQKLLLG